MPRSRERAAARLAELEARRDRLRRQVALTQARQNEDAAKTFRRNRYRMGGVVATFEALCDLNERQLAAWVEAAIHAVSPEAFTTHV